MANVSSGSKKKIHWVRLGSAILFVTIAFIALFAILFPKDFLDAKEGIGFVLLVICLALYAIPVLFVNTDPLTFREWNLGVVAKLLGAKLDRISGMTAGFYKMRRVTMEIRGGKSSRVVLWVRPNAVLKYDSRPTPVTSFDGDVVYYDPPDMPEKGPGVFQERKYTEREIWDIFEELILAVSIVEHKK